MFINETEVDLEIKECLCQGITDNSIEAACCCHERVAKHYLMSKQKNPQASKS